MGQRREFVGYGVPKVQCRVYEIKWLSPSKEKAPQRKNYFPPFCKGGLFSFLALPVLLIIGASFRTQILTIQGKNRPEQTDFLLLVVANNRLPEGGQGLPGLGGKDPELLKDLDNGRPQGSAGPVLDL
jgi:hypothetical protein